MLHVINAEHVSGHRIHLWFTDGSDGQVNLAGLLDGPVFRPLQDVEYFARFQVSGHTLTWPNGADFAPEYLHGLLHATAVA